MVNIKSSGTRSVDRPRLLWVFNNDHNVWDLSEHKLAKNRRNGEKRLSWS